LLNVSRRKARETALRVLYEIELGKPNVAEAIEAAVIDTEISHDLADYMQRLVLGVREHRWALDGLIGRYLKDYDVTRLAVIDKNVLRIAAYELLHVPEIPPAVSINEAIEIARRFSTQESGKFVNGVLGNLLSETPKANWDPATAPVEFSPEPKETVPEVEVEELEVTPEDETFRAASRVGGWKIRTE
jgi:transcription antitermination protein NusB